MSDATTAAVVRPRLGRLDSVRGWRREVAKIYRAMRTGEIATADATRMAYVAEIGHRLTKAEEQLRQFAEYQKLLREQPQPPAALVYGNDSVSS